MQRPLNSASLLSLRLGGRIESAIEAKDWMGMVSAIEQHRRDLGKPLSASDCQEISDAFELAGETNVLVKGEDENDPSAIDSQARER